MEGWPKAPDTRATTVAIGDVENIVYEGGGALGLAYPAAMQALRDAFSTDDAKKAEMEKDGHFVRWPIKGVAGNSIGASFAYFTALGYSPAELTQLAVRDGVFGKVYGEALRPGLHLACVTNVTGKTRVGQYGDPRYYPDSETDPNKNRDLGDELGRRAENSADRPDAGAIIDLIDDNLIGSIRDEVLPLIVKSGIKGVLDFFGVPKTSASFYRQYRAFMLEALGLALVDYFGVLVKGRGYNRDGFDEKELRQFIRHYNERCQELLEQKFPALAYADLGDVWFRNALKHGPIVLLLLSIFKFDRLVLSTRFWRGKGARKRGEKADYVAPGKLDERRRRESEFLRKLEAQDGLNKRRKGWVYLIRVLWGVMWRNWLNDQAVASHVRFLVLNLLRLQNMIAGRKTPASEVEGFLDTLVWRSVQLGAAILFSPITQTAYRSLVQDGGLLPGQNIRDILVLATFNRCQILPRQAIASQELRAALPADGTAWTIARRPEALLDTLNRLVSGSSSQDDWMCFAEIEEALARFYPDAQKRTRFKKKNRFLQLNDALLEDLYYCELAARDASGTGELDRGKWEKLTASLAAVTAGAKTQRLLIEADGTSEALRPIPTEEQFRIAEQDLTFERFCPALEIDLVVTSGNYSNSIGGYLRQSLTPDFPVIEAVRLAGSYPGLFKPTAVSYRCSNQTKGYGGAADTMLAKEGRTDPIDDVPLDWERDVHKIEAQSGRTRRDHFYQLYYNGYFADGGMFNNLPIDAFNGPAEKQPWLLPHQTLREAFNGKTIGFELTNADLSPWLTRDRVFRPPPSPFKRSYLKGRGYGGAKLGIVEPDNSNRSLGAVLGFIEGALMSQSGPARYREPDTARNVLQVVHGNMTMFDMHPDERAIIDCSYFNYRRIYHALTGSPPDDLEKVGLAMRKLFYAHTDEGADDPNWMKDRTKAKAARKLWEDRFEAQRRLAGFGPRIL